MQDETVLGRAYYPSDGVRITGELAVRYEKKPWLEAFEVDGLEALPDRRKGVGSRLIQEYVGTLSDDLYPPALELYRENIERNGSYDAVEYWAEVSRRFACEVQSSPNHGGSPKQFRRYCGFVENMWREGNQEVLDIVLGTILEIITADEKLEEFFRESITDEFKEFLEAAKENV